MTDYDAVGFVLSSQYRTEVLDELDDGPATPSRLAEECDPDIAHVSRALQELRGKDLVDLLTGEDRRKGRIYGATDKGIEVMQSVREMNEGPA